MTPSCVVWLTLEGRDASQGDTDRQERWAPVNLVKFNKSKVLLLAQGNPRHHHGWAENGLRAALGRTWGFG